MKVSTGHMWSHAIHSWSIYVNLMKTMILYRLAWYRNHIQVPVLLCIYLT
jgi:hypothetical protein